MDRIIQVARETGYWDDMPDARPVDAYGYLPPNKVVALCTGSQGEPRAALARIAEDQHPDVTFSRGDRVIYSARTIPGNEKAVGRVINGLIDQGIEVITDRTHLVHVSGHPRRAELEDLIGWVKPKILVPVHGEALHLSEHAALARKCGVKQVIQIRNGDLLRLAPDARVIDEVPAGRLYKDGALIVEADARTVADRRRLSFAGAVSVALAITDKGVLAADPELDSDRHPRARPRRRSAVRGGLRRGDRDRSNPCRANAAATPTRSPKPCAARCARPSPSAGARSRCAMCTSWRYDRCFSRAQRDTKRCAADPGSR